MKEILLINMATPNERANVFSYFAPPLGILSIAAFLELFGHPCDVIDYCHERLDLNLLVQKITKQQITIVGFCVYTLNVDEAMGLAKYLKKTIPNLVTIFGGPHASLDSAYCIRSRYVDYVLIGEGESAMLELVEAIGSGFSLIPLSYIDGLCMNQSRVYINNPARKLILDLDLLPIVKREGYYAEKYKNIINVSSSRGCPAKCIYCACSALAGSRYRVRNIENVVLELSYLKNRFEERINTIYFIDDTFTVFKQRVFDFLKLRSKYRLCYNWRCESRIDVIDKELIDSIQNGGCIAIHFGIESGSQEVLEKIRKRINLRSAMDIISYCFSKRLPVCCYFILGHYCDTIDSMNDTCNLIKELAERYDVDVSLYFNTPYPGTYQYQHRDELGIRLTSDSYSGFLVYVPLIETSEFTLDDQRRCYQKVAKYLNIHNFGMVGLLEEHTKTS